MQKGGIRASFDNEHFKEKSPQESDFFPSLGSNMGENKTSHGRNHKECETLPITSQNKFKKNELVAGSVLDDEFDLDDFWNRTVKIKLLGYFNVSSMELSFKLISL